MLNSKNNFGKLKMASSLSNLHIVKMVAKLKKISIKKDVE